MTSHPPRALRPPAPAAPGTRESAGSRAARTISRDAAWLFTGYAVGSGSGVLFWAVAAVVLPQTTLGVEASLLSIVMAAAAFAAVGPGSALIVLLPPGGPASAAVMSRAVAVTAGTAVVAGAGAGLLAGSLLPGDQPAPVVVVIVTVATVVWALFNLQTQALAGAGSARATAWLSAVAGAGKVALVGAMGVLAPDQPSLLLIATLAPALVATAVSLLVVVPRALAALRTAGDPGRHWDRALSRAFLRFTAQNAVATGSVLALGLSLSFLVTVLSSPAEGAVFALSYQVSVALDLIGVGVATSLARNASIDYDASAEATRHLSARVSRIVLLLGAAATAAAPLVMWLLGDEYAPAQGLLIVAALVLASALRPRYDLWSALLRARQRVAPVIAANGVWILLVLAGCATLIPVLGAAGAALSLLIGAGALALIGTWAPARIGAAPGPVSPAHAPSPAAPAAAASVPAAPVPAAPVPAAPVSGGSA
ncbi:hypothetical protein [Microbacterium sp. PA5]|uniref:hypothetical protein n=1 Tax=Microbacterium sp. PA5 TaxID=3416654 RepID=UPI003CEA3E73